MTQRPVAVGQLWAPADNARGGGQVRVVCRYPFASADDGPMWIIEFTQTVHRLERVPEKTLRALWALEVDVPDS